MKKYILCVGLEMHCEGSETNTKVFSGAMNEYSDCPNTNIRPVDMAFPGTLPVVNKVAVEKALMASIILNCQQPEYIWFERKNYYYPDLPKGFQITQETKPIPVGIYGSITFDCDGYEKTIRVNNIHLEEDAASLDHYSDISKIDYNRAGVPLLELVTEPDIRTPEEAVYFLETMRSIYQYAGISEGDSKKGQIRCDVNISIMDEGLDDKDYNNYGTKVEVKNVNSFGGVRDAIKYEYNRQCAAKENGTYDTEVIQETRRWDEDSASTIRMRSKVDAIDYKYFVEPNIPKYKVTEEWLESIRKKIPMLPKERKVLYISQYNLSEYDAGVIVKEKDISDYFEECLNIGIEAKTASNWLTSQIMGYLNKECLNITELFLRPKMLKEIVNNIEAGKISSKQGKELFFKVLSEQKEPSILLKENNMEQISNEEEIKKIIENVLSNNESQVTDYKNGKDNLFDYFVGQVMKETRGKANPVTTKTILKDLLK